MFNYLKYFSVHECILYIYSLVTILYTTFGWLNDSIYNRRYDFELELRPTQLPVNKIMAARDVLYEEILNEKPSLDELCEHVCINDNWFQMGIMLKLDTRKLKGIEQLQADGVRKMTLMFEHWLKTNPNASRRQIVETLKKDTIEEFTLAQNYEMHLKELNPTTGKSVGVIYTYLLCMR